jgi:putative endonuclease
VVERSAVNRLVVGSNPTSGAIRRASGLLMAFGRTNYGVTVQETVRRMVPSLSRDTPVVYMLRLRSGPLYVGCSKNIKTRIHEHESGTACRTTRVDPPDDLIFIEGATDFALARRREAQIKRWSRGKKLALASGDRDGLRRLSKSRD